jgi:uncharacterized protein YrrD
MLEKLEQVFEADIQAADGKIGRVRNAYFDDHSWVIRYLIVDTGHWLPGRKVLISPESVESLDVESGVIHLDLTCEKIENSPPIEADEPVSRRHERELSGHYLWTAYWDPSNLGGGGYVVAPMSRPDDEETSAEQARNARRDSRLRSAQEVKGYRIHAADGQIGHVQDFLFQTEGWVIRYLLVDTRNWLPGRKVLVSPAWVSDIDWSEAEVVIEMQREEIASSPEYPPRGPGREYEKKLHDHYDRPGYWQER